VAYSIKHKVVSWVSKNLFDNVTYTVRNGVNKGLVRRGGLGWLPFESTETPEALFWKTLDLRGKVVYDIGAFHGLLTMLFARQAKAVVAFEPNSRNRQRLLENIRLNSFSNVTVRPYGLSSEAMQAEMSFDSLVPGTASLDGKIAQGAEHETIELKVLDEEQGLPAPDFIKVDVEGFELQVLKHAARWNGIPTCSWKCTERMRQISAAVWRPSSLIFGSGTTGISRTWKATRRSLPKMPRPRPKATCMFLPAKPKSKGET
jgi:FkbM family methyltransferase